jgi:protein-disulfide isomerase
MNRLLALPLVATLLLVTACGDDDDSDEEDAEAVCTPAEDDDDESVCGPGASDSTAGEDAEVVDVGGDEDFSFAGIPQDGVILGEGGAPVRIELYENFLCPHCADFSLDVLPGLVADYVEPGDVFIVFHHAALGGAEASTVHIAAQCAAEQNLFWPYQHLLFENQDSLQSGDPDALKVLAADVGVDQAAFDQCLDGQETIVAIETDRENFTSLPEDQQGLPLAIVGDATIPAPTETEVREAIDAALAE